MSCEVWCLHDLGHWHNHELLHDSFQSCDPHHQRIQSCRGTVAARSKMVPSHLRLRCHFLRRVPKEAATSSEVGTGKPTPTRRGCPSTKRRWLSRQRWDGSRWLKRGHEWPRLEPKWLLWLLWLFLTRRSTMRLHLLATRCRVTWESDSRRLRDHLEPSALESSKIWRSTPGQSEEREK